MPYPARHAWQTQWDLPPPNEALKALGQGSLSIATRLALLRDGVLTPDNQGGAQVMFEKAARTWALSWPNGGLMDEGRPKESITLSRAGDWSLAETGQWPAWQDQSAFEHKAWLLAWLEEGVDPWVPWGTDAQGTYGLFDWAVFYGDADIVERLLAHPNAPSAQDLATQRLVARNPSTPVSWARHHPSPKVLQHLAQAGLDPLARDASHTPPLFEATSTAMVDWLLTQGASLTDRQGDKTLMLHWQSQTHTQDWPLRYTAKNPQAAQEAKDGAVMGAVARADWPALRTLLQQDPSLNERLLEGPVGHGPSTMKAPWWVHWPLRHASWYPGSNTPAFKWAQNECFCLEATQYLLDTVSEAAFKRTSLGTIPDSHWWPEQLKSVKTGYVQSPHFARSNQAMEAEREDRLRQLMDAWHAHQVALGQPITLMAEFERAHTAFKASSNDGAWKDRTIQTFEGIFKGAYARHTLWSQDQEGWSNRQYHKKKQPMLEAELAERWSPFFEQVATLLQEKMWRKEWAKDLLDRFSGTSTLAQQVLTPALKSRLLPGLLLACTEGQMPPTRVDAVLQWTRDPEVVWPQTKWGRRAMTGLTKAHKPAVLVAWAQAQALATHLEEVTPTPATPSPRRPRM